MQTSQAGIEPGNQFAGYSIERMNEQNHQDVAELHFALYGDRKPEGHYLRKYNTAYTGVAFIGFLAYNNDRVAIAFYGVVPCFLQTGNNKVLAAQSTDTMTHPDFRKKGLLTEVHRHVVNLSKELGVKILFGFGNQDSIPIYKNKYLWEECGTMDRFEINPGASPVARFLSRAPLLKHAFGYYRRTALKRYRLADAGLVNLDLARGCCVICRDSQYLAHKKYNDTIVVHAGGGKVWLKMGNDILAGDMELSGNSVEDIVTDLKKIARKSGVGKIHFCASRGAFLHEQLSKHYEAILAFPVLYKDFGSGLDLSAIRFTFADIDIF